MIFHVIIRARSSSNLLVIKNYNVGLVLHHFIEYLSPFGRLSCHESRIFFIIFLSFPKNIDGKFHSYFFRPASWAISPFSLVNCCNQYQCVFIPQPFWTSSLGQKNHQDLLDQIKIVTLLHVYKMNSKVEERKLEVPLTQISLD